MKQKRLNDKAAIESFKFQKELEAKEKTRQIVE